MSYSKLRVLDFTTKARIPEARAFMITGSAISATVKVEDRVSGSSSVTETLTINGNVFATGSIIPLAATQFTSSNNTTHILVFS